MVYFGKFNNDNGFNNDISSLFYKDFIRNIIVKSVVRVLLYQSFPLDFPIYIYIYIYIYIPMKQDHRQKYTCEAKLLSNSTLTKHLKNQIFT